MIKNVLIVDDDGDMLASLKEGLEKYGDTFSVLTAADGLEAIDMLKRVSVSLVISDLKMPRMDGFGLLAHIMEFFPDIPVIIITGFSTPEMKKLAKRGGAVGYISKPFLIENLAHKILITLRKEAEGGTLHGVSSGIFLQLIEMEERTCTIRIQRKQDGRQGALFFRNGDLLDARVENLQGRTAAYEIFSWDDITLSIQNECARTEKVVDGDLQGLLLEAMRLKDESKSAAESATEAEPAPPKQTVIEDAPEPEPNPDPAAEIRRRLDASLGDRSGVHKIHEDAGWNPQMEIFRDLGRAFGAGQLRLSYIDREESHDFLLLPGEATLAVLVDPKGPRDRIIEVLGWQ